MSPGFRKAIPGCCKNDCFHLNLLNIRMRIVRCSPAAAKVKEAAILDSIAEYIERKRDQPIVQLMSSPQHMGDLILPCPFGHFET
jgi:hypothetical protein